MAVLMTLGNRLPLRQPFQTRLGGIEPPTRGLGSHCCRVAVEDCSSIAPSEPCVRLSPHTALQIIDNDLFWVLFQESEYTVFSDYLYTLDCRNNSFSILS